MLAETVVREQQLFVGDIRHHGIGPMHHRHLNKRQCVFADIQRVTGFDNLHFPACRVIMHFQSAFPGRRAVQRCVFGLFHNGRQSAGMIHFHMIADNYVNFRGINYRRNTLHKQIGKRRFDPVNQRDFIINNQISVIR